MPTIEMRRSKDGVWELKCLVWEHPDPNEIPEHPNCRCTIGVDYAKPESDRTFQQFYCVCPCGCHFVAGVRGAQDIICPSCFRSYILEKP